MNWRHQGWSTGPRQLDGGLMACPIAMARGVIQASGGVNNII